MVEFCLKKDIIPSLTVENLKNRCKCPVNKAVSYTHLDVYKRQALDVTIQGQILDIIKDLQKKHNTSVIIITHDLGVVANLAQDIAVMYSGVIVEKGKCADIFYRPRHPYTWALIESVPRLDLENKQELASIPGTPPDLLNPPKGCPFSTRCRYCMEICKEEMPERTDFGDGHMASCWLHHEMAPKVEMPERKGGCLLYTSRCV